MTRQSLIGRRLDAKARERLRQFLTRPCVVVIDEAHHAISRTYGRLIEVIREQAPSSVMVGLTATPWPRAAGMTAKLRNLFPVMVADVEARDLVRSGVLARPIFHTVDTGGGSKSMRRHSPRWRVLMSRQPCSEDLTGERETP